MLVDGYGNFGLVDGDMVVVMCYIEVCMLKILMEFFCDINKDIIDYVDNYDGFECELVILLVCFFNLFVNGLLGIVVGMVINIFIYYFGEVIDGVLVFSYDLDIIICDLMEYIFGFDFFIVGMIMGCSGICCVYESGCGLIIVCGCVDIEEKKNGKEIIVIIEIFY